MQVIGRTFLPRVFKLRRRVVLQYLLITSFYPSVAVAWILGAINALLFITVQAQGISVPLHVWIVLYIDATAFQLWVYLRARRFNVSPFDQSASGGLLGMAMTVMAAPVYAAALLNTVFGQRTKFMVTPKAQSATGDSWLTFRRYVIWAGLYSVLIGIGVFVRHSAPATFGWPILALAITLAPIAIWQADKRDTAAGRVSRAERRRERDRLHLAQRPGESGGPIAPVAPHRLAPSTLANATADAMEAS
jgi:hypothetical protein